MSFPAGTRNTCIHTSYCPNHFTVSLAAVRCEQHTDTSSGYYILQKITFNSPCGVTGRTPELPTAVDKKSNMKSKYEIFGLYYRCLSSILYSSTVALLGDSGLNIELLFKFPIIEISIFRL